MVRKVGTSVILIVLAASGYVWWALHQPLPQLNPIIDINTNVTAVIPTPKITWSPYGQQAVGISGYGVVATQGEQTPLPTASVAKVMVALAVLQKKPLGLNQPGPDVPITSNDVAIYQQNYNANQSVVAVQAGEKLSEYEALQALLIASANNIADTLVNWAFGSQAAYLAFANNYGKSLGLNSSTFADASGFSPETVSTASDLVVLGQAALNNPVIAQIITQKSAIIPVASLIRNYNVNLGNSVGINGIKTGNTEEAGGCFLFSVDFHGTPLIGAIMGAPDLSTSLRDANFVIDSFRSSLQIDSVVKANQVVAHYDIPWGGKIEAITQKGLSVIDTIGSHQALKTSLINVFPGISQGGQVGSVEFVYMEKTYGSPVMLNKSILKPSLWWRLKHPGTK